MSEKTNKLSSGRFSVFILLALFFLLGPSCELEIGLGASVDTSSPEVEITYPPKAAVVMDSFILAGTVSDDMGVKKIDVKLTHETIKNAVFTYNSPYSENGEEVQGTVEIVNPGKTWKEGTTWSVKIGERDATQTLYNGWDLPDGNYTVEVTVTDNTSKSVSDTRKLTIDNTAPVFIVSNLTSISDTEKNVFGHKIALSGDVKDDNSVSKVFFKVFDEQKEEIEINKNGEPVELSYKMTYM